MFLIRHRYIVMLIMFLLTPRKGEALDEEAKKRARQSASLTNRANHSHDEAHRFNTSQLNPNRAGFFGPNNEYRAYTPFVPPNTLHNLQQGSLAPATFQPYGFGINSVNFPNLPMHAAQLPPPHQQLAEPATRQQIPQPSPSAMPQHAPNHQIDYEAFMRAMYPRSVFSIGSATLGPAAATSVITTAVDSATTQLGPAPTPQMFHQPHAFHHLLNQQRTTFASVPFLNSTPAPAAATSNIPPAVDTTTAPNIMSSLMVPESIDPDEARRQRDMERKRKQRAREAEKNKKQRREKDAAQKRNARCNETLEETQMRQERDAAAHFSSRENETQQERKERLRIDALSHRESRENETPQEREERLKKAVAAQRVSRENETPQEREERLKRAVAAQRVSRENETPQEREERLKRAVAAQRVSRENETPQEREERLKRAVAAQRVSRENETPQEREERLKRAVAAQRVSRENETPQEREERLKRAVAAQRVSRENETPQEREERLKRAVAAQRNSRENETPQEREERLRIDALSHRDSRENESHEQVQARNERRRQEERLQRQRRTPAQRAQVNAQRRNNYHRRNEERRNRTLLIAEQDYDLPPYHLGPMHSECVLCGALYFAGEGVETNGGTYEKCCNHGSFGLIYFHDYPQELMDLLKKDHPQSSNFHANIRQFNNALAMASMDAQVKSPPGRGPFVFRVHGQIHHNIGPALSRNGNNLGYGAFYFIDTQQAADERMGKRPNSNCNSSLMRSLSALMARENALARSYKLMGDVYREEEARAAATNTLIPNMKMVFYHDRTKDQRRYNAPITNEVAGIFVGSDGEVPTPREYTVFLRNGSFNKLTVKNPLLDPMAYPIFWPTGQPSWHPEMWKDGTPQGTRKRITQSEFYSYLLSIRRSFNPLHYSGKLFQQFVVDVWLRMEQNKLEWARHNQSKLRADLYQNLEEFVDNGNGGLAGTRVVLPSTHIGSPRNYAQEYQDTMTMVAKFGKPDYFLTFTCNPKWVEITENLLPGQDASDRPDLVSRVFKMKLKELLKDITQRQIFGKVIAYAFTIEWQKRGLPHAHLLITVANMHKPDTPEKVDKLISAEIPDPASAPSLYEIVKTNMIHRKCGATDPNAPCMKEGKCSKNFPKAFVDETNIEGHGYPQYRRRDTGITVEMSVGGTTYTYDNRHVVPYNKWLLEKYKCHINVEICSFIHACKYLYKYVYKGSDKATVELRHIVRDANGSNVDEINEHLDARYVCPPEAMHRIFGNKIQGRSHSIDHLHVHLPDNQRVSFQPGQERQALNKAANERTTLTAYFALNQEWHEKEQRGELGFRNLNPSTSRSNNSLVNDTVAEEITANPENVVDPRTLLYTEMPVHFTFKKKNGVKVWEKRGNGGDKKIGRMYGVTLKERERFCLRQLLLKRKGARSFEDLRTMNLTVYPTFEAAATAMGLLNNSDCINQTMREACERQMPYQIRRLFASLLMFFVPPSEKAMDLWQYYSADLSEDYSRQGRNALESTALAWYDIDDMLSAQSMTLIDFIPPPLPQRPAAIVEDDPVDHVGIGQEMRSKLNAEQEHALSQILSGVKLAFIDGPGGCGKTFLYETAYHILKGQRKTVICAAWTGIAANLLTDGRTICSTFKLNPQDDNRTSRVRPNSREGALLREMDTLILDEISMLSTYNLEAIDKCLQDVCNTTEPFGGKRILMGGDFRQVLPIPAKHSGQQPFDISLKCSSLFTLFTRFELRTNMRAASATLTWKEFLLRVGNGTEISDDDGKIQLPQDIISQGDLINEIYEGVFDDPEHLHGRAILTPKNRRVDEINKDILDSMDGPCNTYYSYDEQELDKDSDQLEVSIEFMNEQTPQGFPPHKLSLKKGCIIMLIRNLNIRAGLCNGTRLQVTKMGNHLITAAFISGPRKGEEVYIPRIDLISNNTSLSFKMRRKQFPIKLAFCMTINKAQGQSLESVGIDLEDEVFSHGMLYVALSRCKTKDGVKIYTKNGSNKVLNVVDKRALE